MWRVHTSRDRGSVTRVLWAGLTSGGEAGLGAAAETRAPAAGLTLSAARARFLSRSLRLCLRVYVCGACYLARGLALSPVCRFNSEA